jgi:Transposase DDE domain
MSSIPQMATTLQTVLGPDLEPIGRQSGVIQRLRKVSAEILLKMLVFTLLKTPTPKTKDYVASAAQLGLPLTARAVEKRFTPKLVIFLRGVLERVLQQAVAATPVATPLLAKFTSVRVGDSTTVTLPDACAAEFPGCGGKSDSGKAALKIQVVWDLCTGQLKRLLIEPGRHSDAKSAAVEETPPAGSLSLWDLGYFCLKRFRQWAAAGAFWISRWQPGTAVLDPDGQPLDLRQRLRQHTWDGPLDIAVLLGSQELVPCRLIAPRAPREVAARRRQKAYEKAQKSGRTPSREHLEWCEWTILVTNCTADQLTWKEVVVLYRSRWQIELLFKLWKSHNLLATHAEAKSAAWQIAECWAKLIGVVVQHWLLLTTTWLNHRRSLMQAAAVLRNWIAVLMEAIGDRDRLSDALSRLQITIAAVARVNIRRKKPSWFQLLLNPELLEYSY